MQKTHQDRDSIQRHTDANSEIYKLIIYIGYCPSNVKCVFTP